jgi:Xaa-Pro aminopeptidase
MSISSATEIECLKKAYLRDGVSFVRFLAWLNVKLAEAYCNEDALLVELRRKLQVSLVNRAKMVRHFRTIRRLLP